MSNWTDYVKQYARQHGITYGEALSKAAPSYRRGGVVLGGRKKIKRSKRKVSKRKAISGSKKSYKKSPSSRKVRMGGRVPKRCPNGKKKVCRSKPKIQKAYATGKGLSEMFGGCNKALVEALISGLVSKAR